MTHTEILNFRHACKIFDENKKISDEDFRAILEAGILAPSSTGLEQWDFLVIQNNEMKQKICNLCWKQPQITTSARLVVIMAKISELKNGSEYIAKMISRREDKSQEEREARVKFYDEFLNANFKNDDELLFGWSHAQCMFAAMTMMNEAASRGIDSCPIEGIDDRNELTRLLGYEPNDRRVALVLPFGYRINPQPKKLRRAFDDVVKVIK